MVLLSPLNDLAPNLSDESKFLAKKLDKSSLNKLEINNEASLIKISDLENEDIKSRLANTTFLMEEMPKFMEEQKALMEEQYEAFQEYSTVMNEMAQIKNELMEYEIAQKVYPLYETEYDRVHSTEPEAPIVLTGEDAKAALKLGRELGAMAGYSFTDIATNITYRAQDDGTVLAHRMGVPTSDKEKRDQLSYLREGISHWKSKATISSSEISAKRARYDELQIRKDEIDVQKANFTERQEELNARRDRLMQRGSVSIEA